MKKFKQLFCSHRIMAFNTDVKMAFNTDVKFDCEKGIVICTNTCIKCGKKFITTVPYDKFFENTIKTFKEIRK